MTGTEISENNINGSEDSSGTSFRGLTASCFVSYVIQAVVNNFLPLLFIQHGREFGISIKQFAILTSMNFAIQLCVDLIAVKFVDRIGYKRAMLIAHAASFTGLVSLSFLPDLFRDHFAGVIVCAFIYALGGGMLEVVVSPIVDATPSQNKGAMMSLLHSFYCWGHAAVIVLSTLFFAIFGIRNWRIMAILWSLVPLVNGIILIRMKFPAALSAGKRPDKFGPSKSVAPERSHPVRALLRSGTFWLFFGMMFFSGSSEQIIAQWVSAFAEAGLGVNKYVGDLTGALLFALMMGISRLFFAKAGKKSIGLYEYMLTSSLLCLLFYFGIAFIPAPFVQLVLCGLCGFAVGIFWPGTYSAATSVLKGGTPLFALLALAGDLGCMCGPGLVGIISGNSGSGFVNGFSVSILFPAGMFLLLLFYIFFLYGKIKRKSGDLTGNDSGGNSI